MIDKLAIFTCGLAVGMGFMAIQWITWNHRGEEITDEQAAEIWEAVSGRPANGDARAVEIGRKWFTAIWNVLNRVGG